MTFKAFLSCMVVVVGAVVMVPLMCSAWLYSIDPEGIEGWVAFGAASYAWALFTSLCWAVKKWPHESAQPVEPEIFRKEEEVQTGPQPEDEKKADIDMRNYTIKVRKSEDSKRFWVVLLAGNGEVMWKTEEFTRGFSARRAARLHHELADQARVKLDLTY